MFLSTRINKLKLVSVVVIRTTFGHKSHALKQTEGGCCVEISTDTSTNLRKYRCI